MSTPTYSRMIQTGDTHEQHVCQPAARMNLHSSLGSLSQSCPVAVCVVQHFNNASMGAAAPDRRNRLSHDGTAKMMIESGPSSVKTGAVFPRKAPVPSAIMILCTQSTLLCVTDDLLRPSTSALGEQNAPTTIRRRDG